jgi:DnaK suppressor protein
MTRKKLNFFKGILEKQRAEILRQFAHTHRDYREMAEAAPDVLDRATIDGSKELAAFFEHEGNQRWFEINTALAKIESRDYGFCEECGEPIDEERLQAMPTAALCLDCQKSFEAQQGQGSARAAGISGEMWEEEYWGD